MKNYFFLVALLAASCTGSLTDEQRKKIKEEMQNSKISRVSEVQITEAAFERGRNLTTIVQKYPNPGAAIDSVSKAEEVSIRWLRTKAKASHPVEQSMVEAYENTPVSSLEDNVQKIRHGNQETDSLLYTLPVVQNDSLLGVWSVWLSKKKLILSITGK